MLYLIPGIILIVVIIFSLQQSFNSKKKELLEKISKGWGLPKEEYFHFPGIGRYAALDTESSFHEVPKQTLYDIDFFGLFAFVDRTTSKVGQQFLFKKLIHLSKPGETFSQEERVALFHTNKSLRESIQQELFRLGSSDAYSITSLMEDKLIQRPVWIRFLFVSILSIVIILLLSVYYPILLLCLMIPASVNMFIHYWNKNNTFQFSRSFPQLSLLVDVSSTILKLDTRFEDKSVAEDISLLRPFQRQMRLLGMVNEGGIRDDLGQIGSYFMELLKAFFLVEVYTLFHLTRELETKKTAVVNLFNYVGNIDLAISVASLRSGNLNTCRPQFIPSIKELRLKNIYHPLVRNCVKNDLTINGKSILITGSNMSGKSTFLRTIILNSILAQAINTCFADEFISPPLKQYSSILIDDNLFAGTSYYLEEVHVMGSLIKEVDSGNQNLFILDEVFKGTNTVERIASGKAILSYLNRKNNIAIVSTHDIELSDMLEKEFDLYHFTDSIENDKLHFDYKMKAGQLKTRNAIKLLEMSNYPKEITEEANRLSKSLTDSIKASKG